MLWKLNRGDIESSRHVPITNLAHFRLKEEDLEKFLKSRLGEVISEEHLMLIARERKGQEEADLLALDKDGRLYIFELKRWESKSENVLQVLRYGQKFGRYTYTELEYFARQRGELNEDLSLAEWHAQEFNIDRLEEQDFNRDQVFVLITDGTDEDTISAVDYWSSRGLTVVCVPYRVYEIDGVPYMQLQPYNPTGAAVVEREPQYFLVNTNATHDPDAWEAMIGDGHKGKAAAYYDQKRRVCRIPEGATVFLYHVGGGVIAKGTATSGFQKTSFEGTDEAEFYIPLDFDWALREGEDQWRLQAPTARDVNQRLQTGHKFRPTVMSISRHMADAIDKLVEEKKGNDGR